MVIELSSLKLILILETWIIFLSLLLDYDSFAQGCSVCKGIVKSELNADGTGISSTINSGILFLFSSTYILISIIGIFWYIRSKKTIANEHKKEKILSKVSSIHK